MGSYCPIILAGEVNRTEEDQTKTLHVFKSLSEFLTIQSVQTLGFAHGHSGDGAGPEQCSGKFRGRKFVTPAKPTRLEHTTIPLRACPGWIRNNKVFILAGLC